MIKDFTNQKGQKLVLKEKTGTTFIEIETITHLTCEGYLTTIHTTDLQKITISKLLVDYETELAHFDFIRANRSTVVNMRNVIRVSSSSKRILELVNNEKINISRRRMYHFRKN